MLIRQSVLAQIRDGAVTQQFRRWSRPTVKAGGRLTTAIGVLAIDAVEPVEPEALTAADAEAAGYTSVEQLLAEHYDPAYIKSIDRNFSRFSAASALEIAGVSEQAFDDAAVRLLAAGTDE